jgi:hypothetical protein
MRPALERKGQRVKKALKAEARSRAAATQDQGDTT